MWRAVFAHTRIHIHTLPLDIPPRPHTRLATRREACVRELEREGGGASEYNSRASNAKLKCKDGWMAFCNVY